MQSHIAAEKDITKVSFATEKIKTDQNNPIFFFLGRELTLGFAGENTL